LIGILTPTLAIFQLYLAWTNCIINLKTLTRPLEVKHTCL